MARGSIQIERILSYASRNTASDIHLKVGYKPTLRINGQLRPLDTTPLDFESINSVVRGILSESQQITFEKHGNLDCALQLKDEQQQEHRYRVNVAKDRNGPYLTMRIIPENITDVREIGFPFNIWQDIVQMKRGMVLVTGITGSGKTTTLASLMQEVNKTRAEHIITLEDPIEYIHRPEKSMISQRELGTNLTSFADGVKYALREDPDIILIGEIRDCETARRALEATATGHLVFSTLHTTNASETVRRYVNMFESEEQGNIRSSLAANLSYVLSQQLIPYQKGVGRTLAMEIMNAHSSPAIRNHLRKEEDHLIKNGIQTGRASKMLTMDQHIHQLVKEEKISKEHAILYADNQDEMRSNLA